MSLSLHLGIGAAAMSLVMLILFVVERVRRDASHVDVAWAAGIGALAVFYGVTSGAALERRVLLSAMALVWSLRLAGHLLFDRVLGRPEDGRYRALRRKWGERAGLGFFFVFQVQALLSVGFSLPIAVAIDSPAPAPRVWEWLALSVTLLSVVGESIADRQLARFRARRESRGKTCREGLWRYSRHPNYFFEWLGWWAWVLAAVGSPRFLLSLSGPLFMLVFLFKITGIPATEEQALRSRGDDYRRYQRTTSMFVPWFPKKGDTAWSSR